MRRGIGRLRAGGSGVDADAAAWAAAVTGAGGTYSASTLAAVSAFAASAKASGYWTKLNRINLFCGDQLAAAMVPLKVGGGGATETNVNFVGGDYSESTGLTGNGSSKRLRTGLIPSVSLTLNNTHLSVYNRASVAAGGGFHIGADDGTGRMLLNAPFTDGVFYSDQYNNVAGDINSAVSGPYGHLIGSRLSSASHAVYKAGASLNSNATTGGALPAIEIYVFANNGAGVASGFVSHPLGAYSIGLGLTSGEVTAYSTHMQTFQTALARNV